MDIDCINKLPQKNTQQYEKNLRKQKPGICNLVSVTDKYRILKKSL